MAYPWPVRIHEQLFQILVLCHYPQIKVTDGERPVTAYEGFCADIYFKVCSFDTIFSVILRFSEPQNKTVFTFELRILIYAAFVISQDFHFPALPR